MKRHRLRGEPAWPASGFGKETSIKDYKARIAWESWAADWNRKNGYEANAQGHDLSRVAYEREFAKKFKKGSGLKGLEESSEKPSWIR